MGPPLPLRARRYMPKVLQRSQTNMKHMVRIARQNVDAGVLGTDDRIYVGIADCIHIAGCAGRTRAEKDGLKLKIVLRGERYFARLRHGRGQ